MPSAGNGGPGAGRLTHQGRGWSHDCRSCAEPAYRQGGPHFGRVSASPFRGEGTGLVLGIMYQEHQASRGPAMLRWGIVLATLCWLSNPSPAGYFHQESVQRVQIINIERHLFRLAHEHIYRPNFSHSHALEEAYAV